MSVPLLLLLLVAQVPPRDRLGDGEGDNLIPVIGARKRSQLEESLGALSIKLSAEEVARIEQAVPASEVAGTRYQAQQMAHLDSER